MYIPWPLRDPPASAAAYGRLGDALGGLHHAEYKTRGSGRPPFAGGRSLLARQFSDNPIENVNIRTGVIVGVTLGVALIVTCFLLWYYRNSVRCTYRKKRHHKHKTGSSKSSKHSEGPVDPAAEAPPPDEKG